VEGRGGGGGNKVERGRGRRGGGGEGGERGGGNEEGGGGRGDGGEGRLCDKEEEYRYPRAAGECLSWEKTTEASAESKAKQ